MDIELRDVKCYKSKIIWVYGLVNFENNSLANVS